MRILIALMCFASLLGSGPAYAAPRQQGPISWTTQKTALSAPSIDDAVQMGGAPTMPTSLEKVTLSDQRPYGAVGQRPSLLVHFDALRIERSKAMHRTIDMTVALDERRQVICAFTSESADWVSPSQSQQDIEMMMDRMGIVTSPADYSRLRSSIQDVLIAVWRRFGIDPAHAGQIIIRPRFVENTRMFREVNGKRVLSNPPSNVWIVEVLGTEIMKGSGRGDEGPMTTLVAQFRDGDLKPMPSLILP